MDGSTNLDVLFQNVDLSRKSKQGIKVITSESFKKPINVPIDNLFEGINEVNLSFENGGSPIENYHKGLILLKEKGYIAEPSDVINYTYNGRDVGYKKYTNLPDGTKIIEKKLGDIEGAISKNPKTNKWSLISFKMPELILDNGKIEHISGSVIDAIEQKVPKRFRKQLNEIVENFAKSLLKMK